MRRSSRGFTLMEILIAVSIVGLMGAVTAGAFQTSVRARDMVEQDNVLYRQVRISLSRMSRELGSAFVSDRYDPKRYRDQNDRPTNFIGEADRITFTTFAHQRLITDSKETDQAVVEYRVESSQDPDRRGKNDLVRRVKALVQDRMDRDGSEDVLFEDLRKLELAYWDSQRKEWVDEWDTRRTEQKDLLPSRVRITIVANDENGEERRYTTQTRVMLNTTLPKVLTHGQATRTRPETQEIGARRGVALLIVTVSIALLSIMGTQFAYDSRVQFEIAVNGRDEVRAYYLARSGVGLSRLLLSFQRQVNSMPLPPGLGEMLGGTGGAANLNLQLWKMARIDCHMLAGLVETPTGGEQEEPAGGRGDEDLEAFDTEFPGVAGEMQQKRFGTFNGCFLATLGDEEQKINVQRLYGGGGGDVAAVMSLLDLMKDERFEFLFEEEDANGVKATPEEIVIALRDWIDEDEVGDTLNPQTLMTSPFVRGFADENREYQAFDPRYVAKNAPFDSLDELYRVHGVNDRFMAAFRDRFTVYPDFNRNLNINSDDPMILTAAIMLALDPNSPQGRLNPQLQNPLFVQGLIEQIRAARMIPVIGMSVQDFVGILQAAGLAVNPAVANTASVSRLLSDKSETFSIQSVGEAGNVTKTITTVVRIGAQDGAFGRLVYWREE